MKSTITRVWLSWNIHGYHFNPFDYGDESVGDKIEEQPDQFLANHMAKQDGVLEIETYGCLLALIDLGDESELEMIRERLDKVVADWVQEHPPVRKENMSKEMK